MAVHRDHVDLEKALDLVVEPPSSPTSQVTWESQNETLNLTQNTTQVVSDEDSDEDIVEVPLQHSWSGKLFSAITPSYFRKNPVPQFRTTIRKIESCEYGYPYLASFMDSDDNFMIYRRFGFLHARLLLQKQDELRLMEDELNRMDRRDKIDNLNALRCRRDDILCEDMVGETRQELFARMENSILSYDRLLLKAQKLVASNRPPERDFNSVANFVHHKKPLIQGDDAFIFCKEDLITLRPGRESAWLDAIVERILKLFPRSLIKYIFCSKETANKTSDSGIFIPTKSRVDVLVNTIIMIMVLALLILPVYALFHVGASFTTANANTSNAVCMGILLVSTLLFSASIALFTKAKRHELLGAAAAYCALLVVFIANLGISNSSKGP